MQCAPQEPGACYWWNECSSGDRGEVQWRLGLQPRGKAWASRGHETRAVKDISALQCSESDLWGREPLQHWEPRTDPEMLSFLAAFLGNLVTS